MIHCPLFVCRLAGGAELQRDDVRCSAGRPVGEWESFSLLSPVLPVDGLCPRVFLGTCAAWQELNLCVCLWAGGGG